MPPDAPTLMWSIRAIGYTAPSAIADLIDNSISAKATKVKIEYISGMDAYISILDNGCGMDSEELKLAMKYGSGDPFQERSESDLGRFGLGLKTASLSQCRKLTVASKKHGIISAYCWDLDYIFQVKNWSLLRLNKDEIKLLPQIRLLNELCEGTVVVWNKLDRLCAGDVDKEKGMLEKIREIEEHLSLTFHRYLQGEAGLQRLEITSNDIKLKPKDPFYIQKSNPLPIERVRVNYKNEKNQNKADIIYVTPYILPFTDTLSQDEIDELGGKEGLKKNQGFYIYRNKRLIVAADWFRLTRKTDLSKLCRVKVDIPNTLDEMWTIDVKKSMAVPPEIVLKNLKRIVGPIIKAGRRKYEFRILKEKKPDDIKLWLINETRNGVVYNINPDYPVLKELMKEVTNKRKLNVFLRLLEQNIPINSIFSDFTEDKKFVFEDLDTAYSNIIDNLRELLKEVTPEERKETFDELMEMMPFSESDINSHDLGDIANE